VRTLLEPKTRLKSNRIQVVRKRGVPVHLRSDNGSEFIAKVIRSWMTGAGLETLYIASGSPWENGYAESFNSKVRDELLNAEEFGSVFCPNTGEDLSPQFAKIAGIAEKLELAIRVYGPLLRREE
jgi:transposase InsO family protein